MRLLPAQYVRAYVKRNKTDAADALALLEAARASDIKPVGVKSVEQQALQALHRLRSGWMGTRTRRINTLRGFCREFGLDVPVGPVRGLAQIARYVADERSALPAMLRTPIRLALEEIRLMEARIEQLEAEVESLSGQMNDPAFYQRDAAAITAHGNKLGETQQALDAAYARWAELDG